MADRLDEFQKFRADLNEEILGCGHLGMKRFFALDHQAYEPGPLGTKTKELLGLVASAVLRCDDCITYHLVRCGEEGWKREEVIDALNVALIVGGSECSPSSCAHAIKSVEMPGAPPSLSGTCGQRPINGVPGQVGPGTHISDFPTSPPVSERAANAG